MAALARSGSNSSRRRGSVGGAEEGRDSSAEEMALQAVWREPICPLAGKPPLPPPMRCLGPLFAAPGGLDHVLLHIFAFLPWRDLLALRLVSVHAAGVIGAHDSRLLRGFQAEIKGLTTAARTAGIVISDTYRATFWLSGWLLVASASYLLLSLLALHAGSSPDAALSTIAFVLVLVLFTDTIPLVWSFHMGKKVAAYQCVLRLVGLLGCVPLVGASIFIFLSWSRALEWERVERWPVHIAECPVPRRAGGAAEERVAFVRFLDPGRWRPDEELGTVNFTGFLDRAQEQEVSDEFSFNLLRYTGTFDDLARLVGPGTAYSCVDAFAFAAASNLSDFYTGVFGGDAAMGAAMALVLPRAALLPVMPVFDLESFPPKFFSSSPEAGGSAPFPFSPGDDHRSEADVASPQPVWRTVLSLFNDDSRYGTSARHKMYGGWRRSEWGRPRGAGLPLVTPEGRYGIAEARALTTIAFVTYAVVAVMLFGGAAMFGVGRAAFWRRRRRGMSAALAFVAAAAWGPRLADVAAVVDGGASLPPSWASDSDDGDGGDSSNVTVVVSEGGDCSRVCSAAGALLPLGHSSMILAGGPRDGCWGLLVSPLWSNSELSTPAGSTASHWSD